MFSFPYTTFPLADQDQTQGMLRAIRAAKAQNTMNDVIYWLLILAGIVSVMLILSLIINFRYRRRGRSGPLGLFLSLCRAHKLKWSECWLLWRLARSKHLTDPARLFLEPEWFKSARLPSTLRPQAAQLKTIHDRLFAEAKGSSRFSKNEQSHSGQSIEPKGADLPTLKAAPILDVPPWPATALSPPSPPLTNSSDGAPV